MDFFDGLEKAVEKGVLNALLTFAQIISKNAGDARTIIKDTADLKSSSDNLATAVQSQQPNQEGK